MEVTVSTEWTIEKLQKPLSEEQKENYSKEFNEIADNFAPPSSLYDSSYTVITESAKIYAEDKQTILVAVFSQREFEHLGEKRTSIDGIQVMQFFSDTSVWSIYVDFCFLDRKTR